MILSIPAESYPGGIFFVFYEKKACKQYSLNGDNGFA